MKLLRLKITDPAGFRSLPCGFEHHFRTEWCLQEELAQPEGFAPFVCAGPNGSGLTETWATNVEGLNDLAISPDGKAVAASHNHAPHASARWIGESTITTRSIKYDDF